MLRKLPKEVLGLVKKLREDYWLFTIKRRPWLLWLRNLFICTFLLFFGASGAGYFYIFEYTRDLKDDFGQPINLAKPSSQSFKISSYIYDDEGNITGRFFDQVRDPVQITEIPELMQYAFISVEDQRFHADFWGLFKHPGIDPIAIARAGGGNFLRWCCSINWWPTSGASGIAQQYTRLLYADELAEFRNRDRNIWRKIKEARIAIQLTKRYPREKILADILNMFYGGHGVNGVSEIALRYFGKDIRKDELTLREIAIIVSLNKSSALYCPIFHKPTEPTENLSMNVLEIAELKNRYEAELTKEAVRISRARERYNWVLGRMLDDGYISQKEFDNALFETDESLEMEFAKIRPLRDRSYGYSNRLVKEFMLSQGRTEQELSHYGGLRIYTTIDSTIQKIASEEFEKHLMLINEGLDKEARLDGAFIIIDIKTGNILALSGGHNFNETQYNRIMASRSPGSGFKPLTYATAMEFYGMEFYDQVCNCPFIMRGSRPGQRWTPKNFRESSPLPYGYVDMAISLIRSVNLPTLDLARSVRIDSVVALANTMGIWGNPGIVRTSDGEIWFKRPGYEIGGGLVPGLPTAIGASDVSILELVNAYAVFFRGGTYLPPRLIKEVTDSEDIVIFKSDIPPKKRVLSVQTSIKMTALMRAVTKIGTAKISMRNIEQQVAVKTGTSDGPRDVSMWGGTPELVMGIRFGHDDYSIIDLPEYLKKVSGQDDMQVTGGWVAGPLYRKIIDRIYSEARPKVGFEEDIEWNLEDLLNHYGQQ